MIRYYFLTIILFMIRVPMNASDIAAFLPDQSNEWTKAGNDTYYNNETLYDYIDGAAELYLSYGFHTVISRRYTAPGEMDIVAEVFDMKDRAMLLGHLQICAKKISTNLDRDLNK